MNTEGQLVDGPGYDFEYWAEAFHPQANELSQVHQGIASLVGSLVSARKQKIYSLHSKRNFKSLKNKMPVEILAAALIALQQKVQSQQHNTIAGRIVTTIVPVHA